MARTTSRRTARITVVLALVLTFVGLGVAFAYWTSTGTGDGTATTGTSAALTITAQAPVGTISPGGPGQTVGFTVTNPGPGTQALSQVTVALSNADGSAWVPTGTCLTADYTASITAAPTYGPMSADGTASGTATVTLANTSVNQDDCQGQEVPLYFVAS